MTNPLILPDLRELLAEGDAQAIGDVVEGFHPATLAEFAEGLSVEETWRLLQHADIERQAEVFSFLPMETQVDLVSGIGQEPMSRLLEEMSPDDRVDLLKRLDREVAENLIPLVARAERQDIRALLSFPEGSAGAVMTTDYATLPPDITVNEALSRIRQQAPDRETVYYIYVVDEGRRLIGLVSLRDLILAKPNATIADIMLRDVIAVRADQDQEHVARELAKYDFLAMPVVDNQNRLVGIITFDDVADVLQAEATEDFHLHAGIAPSDQEYSESGVWSLYRRRVAWLVILVFVHIVSSGVISNHEDTLKAILALTYFLPMVIGSGGNTGSQAATLMVRALATREIALRDWLRVVGKEMGVGFVLGLTMAVAAFVLGVWRADVQVGLIVAFSMLAIVIFSNLVGTLLPFILTRFRVDPAVASSPLIATVADATGLMIYFSVASLAMQFWVAG
jgi:magnesium transporter